VAEPRSAVLLLNYRTPAETLQCLADLRASDAAGAALLVLDNGSGDGSEAQLRAATEGLGEFTALGANLGYCAAINRGLAWARARGCAYALLLNPDVRVPERILAPLEAVLDHDPSVAGVAPTMLQPDGRVWAEGAEVRCAPNLTRLRHHGSPPLPVTHGPEGVGFLPGACALYRLDDLAAAGDLDERYFMYWEDADLGARLRARGRKLIWLPWLRVVHAPSRASGGGVTPLRKYFCAANSVRWLRRHGDARLWLALLLFDLLLWPAAIAGGGGLRGALAKLAGLWRGLRGRPLGAADVARWLPPRDANRLRA
jgi:GT2 family glycosyltransferase